MLDVGRPMGVWILSLELDFASLRLLEVSGHFNGIYSCQTFHQFPRGRAAKHESYWLKDCTLFKL